MWPCEQLWPIKCERKWHAPRLYPFLPASESWSLRELVPRLAVLSSTLSLLQWTCPMGENPARWLEASEPGSGSYLLLQLNQPVLTDDSLRPRLGSCPQSPLVPGPLRGPSQLYARWQDLSPTGQPFSGPSVVPARKTGQQQLCVRPSPRRPASRAQHPHPGCGLIR